ncbi:MAG TPA: hypothetical protein P5218_12020, partial [Planctomycetota bacterium]|nr:hypothetical protein [Planctomycetota bacterium]
SACLVLSLFASAVPATAQGLSKTLYKDQVNGFKFRPPNKFLVVPSQPAMIEMGILCRMESEEADAAVQVLCFADRDEEPEPDASGEEDKERTVVRSKRMQVEDFLATFLKGSFRKTEPAEDKEIKIHGIEARWRVWNASGQRVEVFSFPGERADFHLVYQLTTQVADSRDGKKWISMISKSGRSFEWEKILAPVDTSAMDYDDLLKYHTKADAQFKDWRVLGTPSKQFIIKTSSKRGAYIKNVITRLERSRSLFEEDFPPAAFGLKMTAISIVRVCGTEEEFHRYGNTSRGVGGWFNPMSEELVLFCGDKDKEEDAETFAVMSHEAFHQYCHFLFQRSEAHRWFDEGHGDYYAAANWFEGKAYVKPEAPGGYNRLPIAKDMIQKGEMRPLAEHLNYNHQQWQTQGPSNVSCYAQSWSLVYMLRQGALGKVPSQYWEPEYADILPHYMSALLAGYAERYQEILKKREEAAKEEGRELTDDERVIDRFDLSQSDRDMVWKQAMDASWGKIDLDAFEKKWLDYVANVL